MLGVQIKEKITKAAKINQEDDLVTVITKVVTVGKVAKALMPEKEETIQTQVGSAIWGQTISLVRRSMDGATENIIIASTFPEAAVEYKKLDERVFSFRAVYLGGLKKGDWEMGNIKDLDKCVLNTAISVYKSLKEDGEEQDE